MKKNYKNHFKPNRKYSGVWVTLIALLLTAMLPQTLSSQQTYTFTHCSATGKLGPTQTAVSAAYASSNLAGSVTVVGNGIQTFTIPVTGLYRITTWGAQGGTGSGSQIGGKGAMMSGEFNITGGTVLKIIVGQEGPATSNYYSGGGGSFVATLANLPLCVAGGGGGAGGSAGGNGVDATITTSATAGVSGGTGGVNGNGGIAANNTNGGAGGGFYTDGSGGALTGPTFSASAGIAFVNGGEGGQYTNWLPGGFGGGGAGWNGTGNGGGGGGYSGGGTSGASYTGGGGGASFNSGANQTNSVSVGFGNGKVVIQELCNMTLSSSGSNSLAPSICAGQTLTLSSTGISNFTWSSGQTTQSIVVSPSITTVYSMSATTAASCTAYRTLTVTVSAGVPTISIVTSSTQVCLGMSATITASGALTYTWNNSVTNGVSFTPSVSSSYSVTGQNGCGLATGSTSITVGPLPVSISSFTNQVCANTAINLSVTASATSYTWQPMGSITTNSIMAVTPSVNTTYTVTAYNGTCTGTSTLALVAKANPTLNLVGTSTTICDGQSVNLSVSGADTYTWNPSTITGTSAVVTPSASTLYQVTGTNSNNCIASANHIVIVNPAPAITTNLSSTVICMGGSVTLSAAGAGSYTWSHGPQGNPVVVSPTISTVYAVIGTAGTNTCTATRFYTVDVATPVLGVSAATTICQGAAATISAGPGTGFSWSPSGGGFPSTSVSPSVTTTFSVTANVLSSGINCPAKNTVLVTVNPLPTVTATAPTTVICRKDPLVITGSGATSYSWSTLAQSASITFSSTVANTQTVTVTGTDVNGCKNTGMITVKINQCNAIGENAGLANFHVYPVPSKGEVFIKCDQNLNLQVVNSIGQVVRNIVLNSSNNHEVSVKDLSTGVYFIVTEVEGQQISRRIVIMD